MRRNVAHHDRAGADQAALSDRNARYHARTGCHEGLGSHRDASGERRAGTNVTTCAKHTVVIDRCARIDDDSVGNLGVSGRCWRLA